MALPKEKNLRAAAKGKSFATNKYRSVTVASGGYHILCEVGETIKASVNLLVATNNYQSSSFTRKVTMNLANTIGDTMVNVGRGGHKVLARDFINKRDGDLLVRMCGSNVDLLANALCVVVRYRNDVGQAEVVIKQRNEVRNDKDYQLNLHLKHKEAEGGSASALASDEGEEAMVRERIANINKLVRKAYEMRHRLGTKRGEWLSWLTFSEKYDKMELGGRRLLSDDDIATRTEMRQKVLDAEKDPYKAKASLKNVEMFQSAMCVISSHTLNDKKCEMVYNKSVESGIVYPRDVLYNGQLSPTESKYWDYIEKYRNTLYAGTGVDVQRAKALLDMALVIEICHEGKFPTSCAHLRAFHQMGNKKVGLVMSSVGEGYHGDPFVFADSHVLRVFNEAFRVCGSGANFEAEIDAAIYPENREMVNEAIASFGQLLNSNYEKGCYFLDELDRDTGFVLTAEIQEWKELYK